MVETYSSIFMNAWKACGQFVGEVGVDSGCVTLPDRQNWFRAHNFGLVRSVSFRFTLRLLVPNIKKIVPISSLDPRLLFFLSYRLISRSRNPGRSMFASPHRDFRPRTSAGADRSAYAYGK